MAINAGLFGLVMAFYLVVTAYLGYLGWKRTKTHEDFMIAGRKVHPYLVAISYGATFISTSAIVGFGGAASIFGMGLLWLTFMNIFVGIFIAFVVFGNRVRKMGRNLGALTFPEVLGRRYGSRFIQGFSGLLIWIFMPLYASIVLIGAGRMLESILQIDFNIALLFFTVIIAAYVILGGLKGVIYADAFQGTLMAVGMLVLLIGTYSALGGVGKAHNALTDFKETDTYANMTNKGAPLPVLGHSGFTAFPKMSLGNKPAGPDGLNNTEGIFWTVLFGLIFGVGIGVLAQPQLVVRCMAAKSKRDLNRAVAIGGVFILLMTGVAFTVGSLSNAYWEQEGVGIIKSPYNTSLSSAEVREMYYEYDEDGVLINRPSETAYWQDNAIPEFVNHAFPQWFAYVFMLALVAAAMSTLSSQFHAMGTSFGHDFYGAFLGKKGEAEAITYMTRVGIAATVLVSVGLGYILPMSIIARATTIFFGLCSAVFLSAYAGGLFWKKATRMGAFASITGGFIVWAIWTLFFKATEAV
ncbi:MAG: sodium:solute symporter family protein, partial [Theionarchaea archaeon]|nr:sodium:solute symporter family protein [Theionarchaea archaeon]